MYNVAVVGATGNVGRKFLEILEERNFPINELYLFASKRSAGKYLKFKGEEYIVNETCEENIKENRFCSIFSWWRCKFKICPNLCKVWCNSN